MTSKQTPEELELVDALRGLRTGYGLRLSKLGEFPSSVRTTLHIDQRRNEADQRRALSRSLTLALHELGEKHPDDAELVSVALNLKKVAEKWLERAGAAAKSCSMSRKTYIRRTNAAFDLLAATMAARGSQGLKSPEEAERIALARLREIIDKRDDCRVRRVEVTIRVDGSHVEVQEVMTVEAATAGVQHYVVGKTLPYRSTVVETVVLSGAELLDVEQPHEHWLLELLAFDRPLELGEEHRFVVLHDTYDMAPMWTATSFHEVDELVIRFRFVRRPFGTLYAVVDFPPKLLNSQDISPILEEHAPSVGLTRLGEAELNFSNLSYNRSYGVGWKVAD